MKNKSIYVLALIWLIIDQVTKFIVKSVLEFAREYVIIPNFFSFYYVENEGAAFSSFTGHTLLLIIISIICLGVIINVIQKENTNSKFINFSLGILLGGMIGNLIDRIFIHRVIDFLSFNIFGYKFPVFNVADIGITCGVALYLVLTTIYDRKIRKDMV